MWELKHIITGSMVILLKVLGKIRVTALKHRLGANSSSQPTAYGGGWTYSLVPSKSALFSPWFIKRHLVSQALFSAGFAVSPGFACGWRANFKLFWPLALSQRALAAIIFARLRRLGGAVLFHSSCPSPSWGYPFWRLGLTVRRSRPPTASAELRALDWSPSTLKKRSIHAFTKICSFHATRLTRSVPM